MNDDDYLWDKSGTPDPDVARLEELLGGMRWRPPAEGMGAPTTVPARERERARAVVRIESPSPWGRIAAFAAAAAIAAFALRAGLPAPAGAPSDLRIGQWLVTGDGETARLEVADVGSVEVAPRSRIRILSDRPDAQHFELAVGSIEAQVNAPPRLFIVETPAARAVDLGCAYTLHVAEDGSGSLRVDAGWVALESREGLPPSLVPAGAVCESRKGIGPGTPRFADAPVALHEALDRYDFEDGGHVALKAALDAARPRDSLSVWHLLQKVDPKDRRAVFERLVELAPPPAGVTWQNAVALDTQALAPWEDALRESWSQRGD